MKRSYNNINGGEGAVEGGQHPIGGGIDQGGDDGFVHMDVDNVHNNDDNNRTSNGCQDLFNESFDCSEVWEAAHDTSMGHYANEIEAADAAANNGGEGFSKFKLMTVKRKKKNHQQQHHCVPA